MKKLATLTGFILICLLVKSPTVKAQDVILQGFYWNTHPGDLTDVENGGIWWDSLAAVAPKIGSAGFSTLWAPPPQKGFAGKYDMGYGPYDYYDLGEFDSKGTIRTRHGNVGQLESMIQALHNAGVNVMADVVLNHRGGGDVEVPREVGGGTGYLEFNPPSGRLPGDAGDFHANNFHPDQNGPYHNPLFFEDICYFNNLTNTPPTDASGNPSTWYFGAPNQMGEMGVDLISWGRYLMDEVGFDELRLDAVKHIEPDYLGKFIIEVENGDQPFALGEFFDYNTAALEGYHSAVTNSSNQGGVKGSAMSLFDFPLRGSLKAVLNDPSGSQDLYNTLGGAGLVWGSSLSGFDVVTWLDTHDTDRTGLVEDSEGCDIPFGNSCLRFETLEDHDPIYTDKEDMGYPFLLASEGRPIVFWKDYFWYGLDKDIDWLIALRKQFANGGSDHIQNLNGYWPQDGDYDGDNNGSNMFAMTRYGLTNGETDGLVLGINDHPTKTNAVYVNTPFSNKHLKDYSDGFMFETSEAFGDGRALVKAQARDYSWYGPTGLYPLGAGKEASHFGMDASPGGCVHFVALTVSNASNYLVNSNAIEIGDEVAAINANGDVVGIGRIGQGFQWDGVHDMVIEVLGSPSTNGMTDGEVLKLVVYDQSEDAEVTIGELNFAANGSVFNFSADRPNSPNRNGNLPTFALNTNAEASFACGAISLVTGFGVESCSITDVYLGAQSECNVISNLVTQEFIISYENGPAEGVLEINGLQFELTASPQTVEVDIEANGLPVDVNVSIVGENCGLFVPQILTAPIPCNESCNVSDPSESSYDDGWQTGDNGGSGFGPWNLYTDFNNPGNGGHFVFTSTENGDGDSNGDGDVDVLGRALGMYANSGDVSNAIRPLVEPLGENAQLTIQIDNGWIENGGTVGLGLQNANGENLTEFFFTGGNPFYFLNDGNGFNPTNIGFTDEGLELVFTMGANGSYQLEATTLGDGAANNFNGALFSNVDQAVAQIRFFNANAGFDGQRNYYVGAMEICVPVDPPTCDSQVVATTNTCPGAEEGSITLEVLDGLGPFNVSINGNTPIVFAGTTIEINDLSSGNYNIEIVDENGCVTLHEVTILDEDTEAPIITCPENVVVNTEEGSCGAVVTFEATAMDNCDVTLSYSVPSGSFFETGEHEVIATATDLSGNTSSCAFQVIVNDSEAPVIVCSADIVVAADETCQAVVTWDEPNSTDNCGIASIISNFQSGDLFPIGSTIVTYEVTDSTGNTATCSFEITVEDHSGPDIEAEMVPKYFFGRYGVHQALFSATDNCDESTDVESFIQVPTIENPDMRYYQSRWVSMIVFDTNRDKIKVISSEPENLYQTITNEGVPVLNEQILVMKTGVHHGKYFYYFDRQGNLFATSSYEALNMISIASDNEGNTSAVISEPANGSGSRTEGDAADYNQQISEVQEMETYQNQVQVFPNPAESFFHINITEEYGEQVVLQLFDQSGRMILDQSVDAGFNTIYLDEKSLTKGMYMVHLIGDTMETTERLYIR